MMANGKAGRIPEAQVGVMNCDICKEPGVFRVLSCVQFVFDKLNPARKAAAPVTLYQCIKCQGFLVPQKDGGYKVMDMPKPVEPGEEWKG